tara:strand:+ start:2378 stop:2659 length:282 start_codon:yes stop_codon:yes gene_type:complete
MNEKTELGSEIIDKIAHLTHWNHHNEARLALAQAMESKKLIIAYKSIIDLGNFQLQAEYIGHHLSSMRDTIDKVLFPSAKKMYLNFDEIWDAF